MFARAAALDPDAVLMPQRPSERRRRPSSTLPTWRCCIGQVDAAFDRLIALIRTTTGDERDQVRVRLLELFETLGNADPRVLKARRDLMTALF